MRRSSVNSQRQMQRQQVSIMRFLLITLARATRGNVIIFAALMILTASTLARSSEPSPTDSARQLIVVRSADWQAMTASLQRYERDSTDTAWRPIGAAVAVVVGRNGMAWGLGLRAAPPNAKRAHEPFKIEGDGKAPAGVFALNSAFGYARAGEIASTHLAYLQTRVADKCVDDEQSRYYNELVSTDRVDRDWSSAEEMHRDDDLYRLGIVVEHNWGTATRRGKGSCIFLHIWTNAATGTDGCTAMPAAAIAELIGWLDPKRRPELVQLPQTQYLALRGAWRLP